jgi:hypothetical protein
VTFVAGVAPRHLVAGVELDAGLGRVRDRVPGIERRL